MCRYTVGPSDNGEFTVKAGTNSVDEADNALAADYIHATTLTLDTTAPAAPVDLSRRGRQCRGAAHVGRPLAGGHGHRHVAGPAEEHGQLRQLGRTSRAAPRRGRTP